MARYILFVLKVPLNTSQPTWHYTKTETLCTFTSWSITLGTIFFGFIDKANWLVAYMAACMHKGKGTSRQTPIVMQPHNRLFSELLTCQISSF